MDLESSSHGKDDLIDNHASASHSTSNEPINQQVERDIETNRKLNLSSGGSQSSNIPQTEFERKPYLDNQPLPKSQSDPTSLGKKKITNRTNSWFYLQILMNII